jgi:hypothetical protein
MTNKFFSALLCLVRNDFALLKKAILLVLLSEEPSEA